MPPVQKGRSGPFISAIGSTGAQNALQHLLFGCPYGLYIINININDDLLSIHIKQVYKDL